MSFKALLLCVRTFFNYIILLFSPGKVKVVSHSFHKHKNSSILLISLRLTLSYNFIIHFCGPKTLQFLTGLFLIFPNQETSFFVSFLFINTYYYSNYYYYSLCYFTLVSSQSCTGSLFLIFFGHFFTF